MNHRFPMAAWRAGPAWTGSRRRRLWICRFAWTTQTRCPHTHSRRKSSSRKLLDLKDKGRRDHTLTSAIHGPSSGVHFRPGLLYRSVGALSAVNPLGDGAVTLDPYPYLYESAELAVSWVTAGTSL